MGKQEIHEQIADLDRRIAALDEEAKPLRQQIGNIDRTRSKLAADKRTLTDKLAVLNTKPRVSDHAVIRYLERKYGFTFEDIRSELLTPAVIAAMDVGADGVRMNGGTLKLKDRCVVTYYEPA